MGSKLGVAKVAAKRAGVTIEEYQRLQTQGLKYCYACKTWHPKSEFSFDLNRGDGLSAICKLAKSSAQHNRYFPKRIQPREQIRAHRLIQMRVKRGSLADPNNLPCFDCGHTGNDHRHEYDHYLGYEGNNKEKVQPVCSLCHAQRHKERKQNG